MSARSLLAITLLSALHLKGVVSQDFACGNTQFLKNRKDVLKYEGVIENGIQGTTNNVTKIKITSNVEVQNWQTCDFTLKFSGTKFFESLGSKDSFKLIPSTDFVKRLEENHLMFKLNDGVVTSITPSVKSTKSDVLNIQRGLLSALQVRDVMPSITKELVEDDVSGSCLTTYMKREGTKFSYIEKMKDLSSCKKHHAIRSNIDGHSYNDDENADNVQDSVYKSFSECLYKLNQDKWGLKKAVCTERFIARAFLSDKDAGAYVTIRTNLTKTSTTKISKRIVPYKDFYTTSIKYDHEQPEDERAKTSVYRDNVKSLLLNLAKDHYHESKSNSAQRFFELVISFRHLKQSDLNAVIASVDLKDNAISSFLFDAMAQCGTTTCLTVLFQTMQAKKMQKEAMGFMPYLAFLKEPTPEVIRMLMGFHQKTNDPSLLLVVTTLSYKMCRNHPEQCDGSGMIGQVVKDMENYLLGMLGNDCQTTNPLKQFKIFYALKGIGNLGRPANAMPLILDCIQNARYMNTTTAAVDATRKMKLTATAKEMLHLILIEKNNDLEKRVEVFLRLMQAPTKEDISLAVDVANDQGEVGQLRSFINSYLRSAIKNKAPSARTLSKLFQEVLKENPLVFYDPSPSRYSKAFLNSFKIMRFGGTVNGHTFFHPDSFVPRSLNFNLTTHLFGFSVNAFEVKARMEGVEQLLGKYMQNDGYFSSEYLKKIFKVPTRQRRSADGGASPFDNIDAEVGVNAPSPQALVSLKIFGNEVQVFNLNDLPFLNGELDDVNVVKYIYELTKGKRKVFKHNMVVMEVTHTVPTLLGMPMKIAINGSAVVTMDVKGKMKIDMKNLLMGPKSALVTGSFQPSVSLHASGKLSVACPGVTEVGTSFLGNVHFGKKFEGSIKYEEGKEMKAELKADGQQTDLLNVSYNIFHETGMKKEKVNGIEKRAKGYFCTDEVFDTSFTGSKICAQASFPNGYYNFSAPFFPLTGPFDVGVRTYPVDPLLTKYLLHVQKNGDTYTTSISTPGATSERKYTLTVGVGSDGTGSKVGLTYGDENRGIVFDYSFDKKTNEVEGTVESNLTVLPLKLYGEFFNITDATTLNRHVGVKGSFKFRDVFAEHTLFYKNTYEYWALGSKFEYAKGKAVSLDLKIQYQPQMFHLALAHPPTNTKLVATAFPSLPKLEGRINITHAKDVEIKAYGQIDISKYQVVGDVNIKPGNHIVTATGKWVPKNKHVFLDANLNGIPLNWKADLKSNRVNKVTIHKVNNNIKVGDKTVDMTVLLNVFSANYTVYVDNSKVLYGSNVFTSIPNNLKVSSVLDGKKMDKFQMTFDVTRNKELHKQCTKGSYGKTKFGSCNTVHHTKEKWGYIYTLLEKEKWKTPLSFLITTNQEGRKAIEAKIYEYLAVTYTRKNKDFSMVLKVPKVQFDINTNGQLSGPKLKYAMNATMVFVNGTSRNQLSMQYNRSTEKSESNFFMLERKVDENSMNAFSLSSDVKGKSFSHIFKLVGKDNTPIYTVVVKDKDTKKPEDLGEESYLIYNMDGWKFKGFENNVKNTVNFQATEIFNQNDVEYLIKARQFDLWAEEQPPMFDIGSLKFLSDGKVQFHLYETPMTAQYKAMLKTVLGQTIAKGVNIVFLDTLKLDQEMVGKLSGVFQQAAISYFSTTACNGDKVHKRFIKGQISKEDIVVIVLRILKFPMSNDFKTITGIDMKKSFGEEMYTKLQKSKGKNVFEFFSDLVSDVKKLSGKDQALKEFSDKATQLKELLEKDKSFNIFEKEFFNFLQQTANEIQKTMASKGKDKMPDLKFVTKHFPANVRGKVEKTLTEAFKVLMEWKYDVNKDPMKNLKDLMDNLEAAGAQSLLKLDHSSIILGSIIQKSKLPAPVERTLKSFVSNLDHVTLLQKLSKFALQTYKVPAPHSKHITKMLNVNNINEYFKALATAINNNGRLSSARKEPFKEFLKTQKMSTLMKEFKNTLKTEHKIDTTFLETLFTEGNMKSFESLPTVYTVNFLPKLLTKLLENVEDLNIPSVLKKLTGFIKDKEVRTTLESFLGNKQNLNELPAAVIKLAIKKTENKELNEQDRRLLKEVEDLSLRFISILANTNKNLAQQTKEIALAYYDSVHRMLKAKLPKSLASRSDQMFGNIRKIIQAMKVQDLNKDATGAVEKATKEVAKTISKFFDENLDKIITEDLMDALKELMLKSNSGEGNLWEKKEAFVKAANDRLSFLIRLLGQFSDSERNDFAERFTKDGKIQYYKIYQSVWNSKVASEDNLKQIAALFKGLEKAAMKHIMDITGDGSVAVMSGKLLNLAANLLDGDTWLGVLVNLTQKNTPVINMLSKFLTSEFKGKHTIPTTLNKVLYFTKGFLKATNWMAVIQEYNKDKPNFMKASYEALLQQIKELLVAIGHAKQGDITINDSIQKYIPASLQSVSTAYKNMVKGVAEQVTEINDIKDIIRRAFKTAKEKLKETRERDNNVIVFLVDVLLPGMDSIIGLASNETIYQEAGYDRCTSYMRAYYRKPFGKNVEAFEKDKALQKMIKDYSQSSMCSLWNFMDDVKVMKKDKSFVDAVLDKLMKIVLNALDENVRHANKNVEYVKTILETAEELTKKKMTNPLQETVFLIGQTVVSAVEKNPFYGHTERILGQKLDLKTLFEQKLSNTDVTWTVPTSEAEKKTKEYIDVAVKKVSKELHKISKDILFGIDKFKAPLSKNKFVVDPLGYVKALPNKLVQDVLKNIVGNKKIDFDNMRKLEKDLKAIHKKMSEKLRGYSGKLNAVSKKLLKTYKANISKYIKPALDALKKHNQKMNKELKNYMVTSAGNGKLMDKLQLLTAKANAMRNKYKGMQEAFVQELKKNLTRVFSDKQLMKEFNEDNFVKNLFANIDRKALATVLGALNQDMKGLLTNTIYPHFAVLVKSVDETVCKVKKNISKVYTVGEKASVVSWELPHVYQALVRSKQQADSYGKLMNSIRTDLMKNITKSGVTMENIQRVLQTQMEIPIDKAAETFSTHFTVNVEKIFGGHSWYQQNAGKEPDTMVQTALKEYQNHIKQVAIKVNKAMQIVPPDAIEKPVIKFFGLQQKPKQPLLQPLSRTAYLFEQSIVTFDGKPIYLPKGLKSTHKDCLYLLSRDFLWKNFTVYLHENKLVVELKDGKVVIDRSNNNKVEIFARVPPTFTTLKKFTDLPVQMAYTSVVKVQPNVLKIHSLFGLMVYCRLDAFSCNFTVSGYYHNKALGLFGTNNVEHSDDLRLPNGQIALDLSEFLNSYEITKSDKCVINDMSDVITETEEEEEQVKENECDGLKNDGNKIDLVDFTLRSNAFYEACKNEKVNGPVKKAYMSSVKKEFGPIAQLLNPMGECSTNKATLRYSKNPETKIVQLTVLLKLLPELEKVRPHLMRILQKIQQDLGEKYEVTYTVIGYGGERVRSSPHLQTGDGDVFMDLENALKALETMEFRGEATEQRQGLAALKFASELDFEQGTNIFLLLDNDESYTNSLREMIDVNNALNERGIVLNVVNTYKMRKDIIGKDSSGKRYHVREPLGEDFPNVSFPPPDDYIPLVKQSRGAVFTLKAFTKNSAKLTKALPITLSSAVKLQAKIDQNQCKECMCGICKNVLNEICDLDL